MLCFQVLLELLVPLVDPDRLDSLVPQETPELLEQLDQLASQVRMSIYHDVAKINC